MQPKTVVGSSVVGLAIAAFRTFLRSPILFVLLSAVQLVPAALMKWTAVPASTSPFGSTKELLLTELIVALLQVPVLHRAAQVLQNRPRTLGDVVRTTMARTLPVFALTLLQFVITTLGTTALLLPGVVAYLMLFVAAPVCIAERAGPLESLSRSADMTRGVRWRILGAVVLLLLPVVVVVVALALLASTSARFDVDHVFDAIGALTGTWLTILSAVIYEDLRKARDGEQIAEVFG